MFRRRHDERFAGSIGYGALRCPHAFPRLVFGLVESEKGVEGVLLVSCHPV